MSNSFRARKVKPKGMGLRARAVTAATGVFSLLAVSLLGVTSASAADVNPEEDLEAATPTYGWTATDDELDRLSLEVREGARQNEERIAALEAESLDGAQSEGNEQPQLRSFAAPQPAQASLGYITGPVATPEGFTGAFGPGYEWHYQIGDAFVHWLGAMKPSGQQWVQWCREFAAFGPVGPGELEQISPNFSSDPDVRAIQADNNEVMGYILAKWAGSVTEVENANNAERMAAISAIVHSTYEPAGNSYMGGFADTLRDDPAGQGIYRMAVAMLQEARSMTGPLEGDGELKILPNRQDFYIEGIAVKQMPAGVYLGGIPVTVKLVTAAAEFDSSRLPAGGTLSADKKTWTGVTSANGGLTLHGYSTANGKVGANVSFAPYNIATAVGFQRPDTQGTVDFQRMAKDPTVPNNPARDIVNNFQPMLISDTEEAGGRILPPSDEPSSVRTISDHIEIFADPNYEQTAWLGVGRTYPGQEGYTPLPIKFTGTAYDIGNVPIPEGGAVPQGAKPLGSVEFVANGPGEHVVVLEVNSDPKFFTWVWTMEIDDQPSIADSELYMIADDWADNFGIQEELGVLQWDGKIQSNLKIHEANEDTFLVDDVWVDGLPVNYPNFEGGFGFAADTPEIVQSLYFWPGKTKEEVTSLVGATKISSMTIPAKNGFYPSVGSLQQKVQKDADGKLVVGVYQVVHNLVAPDNGRVAAFTSLVPDVYEMFEVTDEPTIQTTASGSVEQAVGAFEDVVITDNVCYTNLKVGKTYDIEGTLMNKATGEPLLVDGKEITASKTFVASNSIGCEELEFKFNASALAGETVVVFEDLLQDGIVVATHSDINDRAQTVDIPKIGTTASGVVDNLTPATEEATITDTVSYEKLVPGKEYTMKGVLKNKETGEDLLSNDAPVTAETTFTPTKPSGTVDLVFTFDASALAGTTTVVFEDLFRKDILIATHSDIEDEGQTVYIPGVKTKAAGIEEDLLKADKEAVLVDTVEYTNLSVEKEYTTKGTLKNQETGEDLLVDGKPITGEVTFTPTEPNGTVDMEFRFDASVLEGTTTVVFEDLYRKDILIATHSDLTDKDQTVYIPKIGTTATSKDGGKTVKPELTTITDKVCYTNLSPNKEYELKGTIQDKSTNKPLTIDGEIFTTTAKFTPEESEGCTNIDFTFDASKLAGRDIVVFESLYRNGVEIAVHADINDKGQTITVEDVPPTPPLAKTGTGFGLLGFALVALIGLGATAVVVAKKRA